MSTGETICMLIARLTGPGSLANWIPSFTNGIRFCLCREYTMARTENPQRGDISFSWHCSSQLELVPTNLTRVLLTPYQIMRLYLPQDIRGNILRSNLASLLSLIECINVIRKRTSLLNYTTVPC